MTTTTEIPEQTNLSPGIEQNSTLPTLSVILNIEPDESLELLEELLLALAVQEHSPLELILLCCPTQQKIIDELCANQNWQQNMSHRVIHCDRQIHTTRADRLNHGFHSSTGNFLCILEVNDIVYSHTFSKMLQTLQKSHAPLLVGGTRTALRNSRTGYILHKSKVHRPAKRKSDLWYDHECVKHFMIDKSRIQSQLATESSLDDLETYFFLLNFTLHNEIDFSLASDILFERRIATELEDYSPPPEHNETSAQKAARLERAHSKVLDWKAQHFELMNNALLELRKISLQSATDAQPAKQSLFAPLMRLFNK